MKKDKQSVILDKSELKEKNYVCKNTYLGKYGNYYKGNIYILSYDKYFFLKSIFDEVE